MTDPLLPSNSAILMPTNTQSFSGPGAEDRYRQFNSRPMKHELMHVLQNIDSDPFRDAKFATEKTNPQLFPKMHPGYGGSNESEAYLLSRTGDLNNKIKEKWGMDRPDFEKQRSLMDWLKFPPSLRKQDMEGLRSDYMKELPAGLREIIDSIVGTR